MAARGKIPPFCTLIPFRATRLRRTPFRATRWCHVRAYLDDLARVDSDQTVLLFHHDQWYSVSRHLNRISFFRHPLLEQLKTRDIVLCPNTFTPGIWCEMDRLLSYTESARSVERSVLAAGGGDISIAPHVLTCEDLIQCLTSVLIDKVSHH